MLQAIQNQDVKGVHDLLDADKQPRGITADVNMRSEEDGLSPLHIAVEAQSTETIQVLLKYYAELNA